MLTGAGLTGDEQTTIVAENIPWPHLMQQVNTEAEENCSVDLFIKKFQAIRLQTENEGTDTSNANGDTNKSTTVSGDQEQDHTNTDTMMNEGTSTQEEEKESGILDPTTSLAVKSDQSKNE